MPRFARLDAPGLLQHVIIRGIERRKIFEDNKDRYNLLDRLAALLPDTQTACYAWTLIPNHAHFLFRTGVVPLATVMRRLLTGYAVTFNRRHKRHGQLFQNRYKSIVCQEDVYLKELVRYIHLNPIRAKIVSDLAQLNKYQYCGHSALTGKRKRPWQDVDDVLRYFGKTVHRATKAYVSYVAAGVDQGHRDDLIGGGLIRSLGGWSQVKRLPLKGRDHVMSDERILGGSDFVDAVLSRAGKKYDRRYELIRRGYDLDRITQRVAKIYDMEPDSVTSKGKQKRKVTARSVLCFWAVRELGMSLTAMAERLGISVPAVGYAVQRGEAIVREKHHQLI